MWNSAKQPPSQQYQQPRPQQIFVYNIPSTSIPTYPAVRPVQRNAGWCERNYKNKPQSNSSGIASLIFISGGMNMSWKLGFLSDSITESFITKHMILSWFIGGIIGVIVGALLCNVVSKKILMCFSSVLVVICGILQVSDADSYESLLASRYLNGIAVGLVFPMTFVLIGEECVKSIRGTIATGVDVMSFSCGVFIQIIYSFSWTDDLNSVFQSTQMNGVLNITWGVIAFILGAILIIESPVLYLACGQEQLAIDALRRLQRPFIITYETYEQLEEHKRYVAESNERTFLQNAAYGLPALLKLCLYRSFTALSFSCFVNSAFLYSHDSTYVWSYMLYAISRWLGPLILTFTLDYLGRLSPMIFGFIVCTILAFTVGGLFDYTNDSSEIEGAVIYILIFYQLFASISISSSSAYLSEAFPLIVKQYYIAIVFIVEMLVQIITISFMDPSNMFHLADYFLTLGALSLFYLIVAIFVMPETKHNTLRECLPKFRKLINYNS